MQQAPFLVTLDTCIIDLAKSPTRLALEREGLFWLKDIVYPGGKRQQWELMQSQILVHGMEPPTCRMALLISVYLS